MLLNMKDLLDIYVVLAMADLVFSCFKTHIMYFFLHLLNVFLYDVINSEHEIESQFLSLFHIEKYEYKVKKLFFYYSFCRLSLLVSIYCLRVFPLNISPLFL